MYYQQRKDTADTYLEQQISIVASCLGIKTSDLRLSTTNEDRDGSDLFTSDGRSIGLRVRRAEIFRKFPDDYSVRLSVGCDGRNELGRIKRGHPDLSFYFYGELGRIIGWKLLDLAVFRLASASWFYGVQCQLVEHDDYRFMAYSIPTFARYGVFQLAEG
jgi:hypothetical protein